jgi:predicted Zn finger-like uncharacterized protein
MRLTCPNCGAQYEVPEEVIPEAGRDVQCSNCGDTWFQTRHGIGGDTAVDGSEETGWVEDIQEATAATSDAPRSDGTEHAPADDGPDEPDRESDAPLHDDDRPAPERRGIDPDVASVLREEASREQQARAAESATLETQPDLGLSGNAPEDRRARQARERMARLRGEEPHPTDAVDDPVPDTFPDTFPDGELEDDLLDPGSRRNLLPDVEEINSSIAAKPDEGRVDMSARDGTRTQPLAEQKKGGFVRGLAIAVIVAVAAVAPYIYAPQIKAALPAVAPSLDAYVATMNEGRAMLETQLGDLPQTLREMMGPS